MSDEHPDVAAIRRGTAIQLVRIGEYAIVRVEAGGQWIEVIRERIDDSFCHIVEASAIADHVSSALRAAKPKARP